MITEHFYSQINILANLFVIKILIIGEIITFLMQFLVSARNACKTARVMESMRHVHTAESTIRLFRKQMLMKWKIELEVVLQNVVIAMKR